ncbi:hypothetical protein Q7O_002415 [Pectobacterium carotovorum subsp. carotovorum PCCS1]|nr:hypothetical protein [Pectobacterium carotovorum subsp. carotovorum PCCS1]
MSRRRWCFTVGGVIFMSSDSNRDGISLWQRSSQVFLKRV